MGRSGGLRLEAALVCPISKLFGRAEQALGRRDAAVRLAGAPPVPVEQRHGPPVPVLGRWQFPDHQNEPFVLEVENRLNSEVAYARLVALGLQGLIQILKLSRV